MNYEILTEIGQIKKGEKVFVWGNGKNGRHIFNVLKKSNIEILGVIVPWKADKDPTNVLFDEIDSEVLAESSVVVSPLYYIKQIMEQLGKRFCQKIYINLLTSMNYEYCLSNRNIEEIYEYANMFENGKDEWYSIMNIITLKDVSRIMNFECFRPQMQYIEFGLLKKNARVIDGGGHIHFQDGLGSIAEVIGPSGQIYAFDPQFTEDADMPMIKKYKRILYKKSNQSNLVYLDDACLASFFDASSKIYKLPEVISIDEFCRENNVCIDFLKLDLEKYEKEAMEGAVETIRRYRPNMAIGIYHSFEEFFEIIDYINSLKLGYKFSFAGYSNMYCESILYAYIQ